LWSDPYSRVPADSAEATRYLQDSIGTFARAVFALAGVMLVASIAMGGGYTGARFWTPGRTAHTFAVATVLIVWLRCRGRTMRARTLNVLDAALTIALCSCWAMLGIGIRRTEPIEIAVLLAVTHTLMARSVVVPSSFGQTLWISALSAVPPMVFFVHRAVPFLADPSGGVVPRFYIFTSIWLGAAVFMSALNSRKLYGLRERIREAGKLGQYTLEEKLGQGGMGVVYRASHAMLRRPAAIKLLLPGRGGEEDLARFEREVQLTSCLTHPNTISIFDYGRTSDGVFYYVMEYLNGLDLQHFVDEVGAVDPARAIHILAQASGALAEAHALGLIHRDIKPANIMLTERPDEPDVVKVVDFGLVRTLEGTGGDATLTNIQSIVGTPLYLAPEAITSPDGVAAPADIYALGAVGYFLLTGGPVFSASTIVEVCGKHLHEKPMPPAQRLGRPVPADLSEVILSCLAKRPQDRPASAGVLRSALLACADSAHYDVAAARAWWRHRGTSAPGPVAPSSSGPPTMMVDLRRREPAVTGGRSIRAQSMR
jgi:serine/threonine-protein kinase